MRPADYFLLGGTGGSTPSGPLGRLTTSGVNFLDAGNPWKYRAVTAFTLFQDSEAAKDFLYWVLSLGANTVRVFGMWSITDFDPRRYGEKYYANLDQMCRVLWSVGLRLHFVAFTDQVSGSSVLMSRGQQSVHLDEVCQVLDRHPNTLLEICNEDWKNGRISGLWPPQWFGMNHAPLTRSSWEDGNTPLEAGSVLDFTTEHTPRGDGWERKSKNLLETSRLGIGDFPPTNKPAIAGEPERLQNATPRQYADYVAVAELFASGACLHGDGDTLQRCRIPADQSVARAVAAVWADPPPADLAAIGHYTRGGLPDFPLAHDDATALRRFAMIHPDERHATAVIVSPRTTSPEQPVNGWRVVRQYGYDNNTIDLER